MGMAAGAVSAMRTNHQQTVSVLDSCKQLLPGRRTLVMQSNTQGIAGSPAWVWVGNAV